MDDASVASLASKFPSDQPNDTWTVEQLLHWSLDQYQTRAMEQTSANIASLTDQCEKECEDVMTLHEMALDMANKKGEEGAAAGGSGEENVNPQQSPEEDESASVTTSKSVATSASAATSTSAKSTSSSNSIEIAVIVGPHSSSKFLLRPTPSQPCLIGRSKGKKFIKNGVSLHKDQEVSTTHGKFLIESSTSSSSGGGGGLGGISGNKFYFMDVGSTNGTTLTVGGDKVEPNVKIELFDGMELCVGNSTLKIIMG